jgi:hypothetical protein
MARISIEIDTESSGPQSHTGGLSLVDSANQVGLLSSVKLGAAMINSFNRGLGGVAQTLGGAGYIAQNIKGKKDSLRTNCKVIATVGGSVVFNALAQEPNLKMPPFVSLVGSVPTGSLGNCRGGVSLESFASNSARKSYIKGLGGGYTDANIYLYTNSNSAMHALEKTAWSSDGTFIESNVGDGAGNNDANKFNLDFHGIVPKIPGNAAAIIVSDDPFFGSNQPILVPLLNEWILAGAGSSPPRKVVYPSQIYGASTTIPAAGSVIVGPDLLKAYTVLGALSGGLLANTTSNFGFIKLANETFIF